MDDGETLTREEADWQRRVPPAESDAVAVHAWLQVEAHASHKFTEVLLRSKSFTSRITFPQADGY